MRQASKLRSKRKRCLHCRELFDPDPRTKGKQRYCSAPVCQQHRQRSNEKDWRVRNPECLEYQRQQAHEWHRARPWYSKERRARDPELDRRNREFTRIRMRRGREKKLFDKSKVILTQLVGNKVSYCYLSRGAGWMFLRLTKARSLIRQGCLGHNRSLTRRVGFDQARLPKGRLYDLTGAFW